MSTFPLPSPLNVNGWFSRFSIEGDIASGAGTIVVNGRRVADVGHGPKWVRPGELVYQGFGDRLFSQVLPNPGSQFTQGPAYYYGGGGGAVYICGPAQANWDAEPYLG